MSIFKKKPNDAPKRTLGENSVLRHISNWIISNKTSILSFFIPVVILFAVFAAFQYYPFGDYCPLALDLNGQYIYYYEHMRDAFWGDASYIYSWSRNLGGEMMGIYGYYLASPFMIIICLLPRTMILESVMIMQLAKIGTCGLTFNYYLRKSKGITSCTAIIFPTLYALMSYAVVQLMDPMWLDGLIYLPLITYGIEQLITKRKKMHFIIPLALMFIAHFYIGWMIAIYCVLYFLVYLIFIYDDEEKATFKKYVMTCVRFGISALVAGACAAIIIVPVYYSLKLGKFEFSKPNFSLSEQFVLLDFFTKLLPESYDTVRNEGLPFVYCGMLTVFMLPLFFMNSNITSRKKVGSGILLTLIFLSMYLSTVDLVWHGLQTPNWLPYRYSFIFSFIMLYMAAEAFEHIEGISFKQLAGVAVALGAAVIYFDKQGYEHLSTRSAIWFSIICIVGYGMLLFHYKKNSTSNSPRFVILILVAGELFGGSLQTLDAINSDVVYSKRSGYVDYIKNGRAIVDELDKLDSGLYRTEKTFHRSVNDPMAFQTYGISHSSSTLNAGVINLLDKLGYASRGHYVKYNGTTLMMDDLLGIKYVMTKDVPLYYDKLVYSFYDDKSPADNIFIYENENALSFGYMVDEDIKDLMLTKYNPFNNQNRLLSTMLGEEYTEYFIPIPIDNTITENVSLSNSYSHDHYTVVTEGQNAQLEHFIIAPTEDPVYMYLGCDYSGYEKKLNIWVNHDFKGVYFKTDNYCIKPIGQFKKGENISIITTLTEEDVYIRDTWFYYLDEEKLDKAIETLKTSQLEVTSYSDTSIDGTINVTEQGKVLMMTVPYEDGWKISVDGEEVEYFNAAGGLIAFDVPEGTHNVSMKFSPWYLKVGAVITLAGIIAAIVLYILERRSNKILLERLYK